MAKNTGQLKPRLQSRQDDLQLPQLRLCWYNLKMVEVKLVSAPKVTSEAALSGAPILGGSKYIILSSRRL